MTAHDTAILVWVTFAVIAITLMVLIYRQYKERWAENQRRLNELREEMISMEVEAAKRRETWKS